jgi:Uma2 family endonuclease
MAKTLLTLEQFLALEDQKPSLEYSCGEAFPKPMPNLPHSRLQAYLVHVLWAYLAMNPLGEPFPELRCVFGPAGRSRAFVPDVCFVATERINESGGSQDSAPEIAVEILSPDQDMARFVDKIQFYLLHGVKMV